MRLKAYEPIHIRLARQAELKNLKNSIALGGRGW